MKTFISILKGVLVVMVAVVIIYGVCCGIFGAGKVNNSIGHFGLNVRAGLENIFDDEAEYSVEYTGGLIDDHYVGYVERHDLVSGKTSKTRHTWRFEGNILSW